MRILHISDLHFGDNDTIEQVKKELVNFIDILKKDFSSIDFVFMTGDMVFYSSLEKSYYLLDVFLNELKKIFNIESNAIYYVTGNHENICKFNKKSNEYSLFCKFIDATCNKKCKKYFFKEKLGDLEFWFFNSTIYNKNGKIVMHKALKSHKAKTIRIQHGEENYYNLSKPLTNGKLICGHKIRHHHHYIDPLNLNDSYSFVVGSEDGFCSGKYIFGVYDFEKQIMPKFYLMNNIS